MQSQPSPPAFALAKIQPPRLRRELVQRSKLERSLDDSLRCNRLTLLVAPAGYGKTSALARQIELLPQACALAWVSADEDDQLQRFLTCLTTALQPFGLPWRVAPQALPTLALAHNGVRAVADEIVNALALATAPHGLIVIDDAHRINDPPVFELLQAVLNRLPEQWGLAIASRVEPPLNLARWRASGELGDFRQYELRFDEGEVDALLRRSGLHGSAWSAPELLARTDGWAAGLRLSLSAAPDHSARGAGLTMQRHLFDYLASEVFDEMPPELRRFLLRCAILPELTAARCAQLSGLANPLPMLDEIERRGLFVSALDASELTLRLHDLFREFLEDRLQRDHPEQLPGLLRLAAAGEPDLLRAVSYLLRARAWDEAAALLEQRGQALLMTGAGAALEQMLAQFPADEFEPRPELHFLRGLAAFPNFDFDQMVASMQRAAAGFMRSERLQQAALAEAFAFTGMQNTGQLDAAMAGLERLRGMPLEPQVRTFVGFASAWAAYAQGRAEQIAPHVEAMLDALEQGHDPQVWDRCFFLSLFAGLPNMRGLLERFVGGALRLSGDRPTQLRAGSLHIRAWLAFARGDLDAAAASLADADEVCRWLGRPRSLMTENWMAHTVIDAVRGDRAGSIGAALENRHDIENRALLPNRLCHQYEEAFTHIRACWLLGESQQLRERAGQLTQLANRYEWQSAADDRLFSRALVALLDADLAQARELLRAVDLEVDRSCFFPAAQARLTLAWVELQLDQPDAAALLLRRWLDQVHAGADVGGALMAGAQVLQALAGAAWDGRLDATDCALLDGLARQLAALQRSAVTDAGGELAAASRPPPDAQAAAPPLPADPALASLTTREREVLERMAAGDSNKLIARRFALSPHTVKRHVANILDKLDARSRGQAAARWRA